jgi:hypothetical protein
VIITSTALIGRFRFSGALGHTDFLAFALLAINKGATICMAPSREKND